MHTKNLPCRNYAIVTVVSCTGGMFRCERIKYSILNKKVHSHFMRIFKILCEASGPENMTSCNSGLYMIKSKRFVQTVQIR